MHIVYQTQHTLYKTPIRTHLNKQAIPKSINVRKNKKSHEHLHTLLTFTLNATALKDLKKLHNLNLQLKRLATKQQAGISI